MPAKKTKKMLVWVTKSKDRDVGSDYNIYAGKEPKMEYFSEHDDRWYFFDYFMESNEFEEHFFKLKPGAGPVKCEMQIRRVK